MNPVLKVIKNKLKKKVIKNKAVQGMTKVAKKMENKSQMNMFLMLAKMKILLKNSATKRKNNSKRKKQVILIINFLKKKISKVKKIVKNDNHIHL